ncbi:transcription factor TFIIIB subunit brf1 [Lobulomyces angularis]|nr:transcription factor TFIIIB subunit brf1 [Lobulomyces angularis]
MSSCNCNAGKHKDASMGHTVCKACGTVLEENEIIAEVGFTEKSNGAAVADGFLIAHGQARAKSGGYNKFSMASTDDSDKHQITLANGNRKIAEIAHGLRLSQRHVEMAERNFKLAVNYSFTKGRKIAVVAACCLYIVCRLEKTSHMLMDFAGNLHINVYVIGTTYVKLVQILHLREKIPHIDPALYIARFCALLQFEDKVNVVISDCLRLISRMDRDWMALGRRPAGICAAAIFIASRMNGFIRTKEEIVHVVKICTGTLKSRLSEFGQLPTSKLSVDESRKVWLESAEDPPCFMSDSKKNLKKVLIKNGSEKVSKKRKHLNAKDSSDEIEKNIPITPVSLEPDIVEEVEEEEVIVKSMMIELEKPFALNQLKALDKFNDDDLSCFDTDPEVIGALNSELEMEFKKEVFNRLNRNYTENRDPKKKGDTEQKEKKKRVKKSHNQQIPLPPSNSLMDSVHNMLKVKAPQLSSKINYEVFNKTLEV